MAYTQDDTVYDQIAVEYVLCPYCGAGPEQKCLTKKSGNVSMFVHAERLRGIREAYRKGTEDADTEWVVLAAKDMQKALNRLLSLKKRYEKKGWI